MEVFSTQCIVKFDFSGQSLVVAYTQIKCALADKLWNVWLHFGLVCGEPCSTEIRKKERRKKNNVGLLN